MTSVVPGAGAATKHMTCTREPPLPPDPPRATGRAQAETSEAAEAVAQAAEGLVQLCSLLPAGAAVFGDAPVAAETKRRAAEVEAGEAGHSAGWRRRQK